MQKDEKKKRSFWCIQDQMPRGERFFCGGKRRSFDRPHCLSALRLLGGPGQFSKAILAFFRHLCIVAKLALESTGSTITSFSPEEEANGLHNDWLCKDGKGEGKGASALKATPQAGKDWGWVGDLIAATHGRPRGQNILTFQVEI